MIQGRHIRWDWKTWIDYQDATTVRTLCRTRTKVGLAGIPGMTFQSISVDSKGKSKYGWCIHCMKQFSIELLDWITHEKAYTSDIVLPCYVSATMVAKGHQAIVKKDTFFYGVELPDPVQEQWLKQ